jgi:hypothetical protein
VPEDLREMVSMRAWAQEFTIRTRHDIEYDRLILGGGGLAREFTPEGVDLNPAATCDEEKRYDILLSLSEEEARALRVQVVLCLPTGHWVFMPVVKALEKALSEINKVKIPEHSDNPSVI